MPTTNYCDYSNGDDDTGDGSAGNPYKTIDKASTGLTGGDEVRCAKSAAPSILNGTLAWVDGSSSIATSVDLTGVLAAKDFVGKDTAGEIWWEISSIISTAITLAATYRGTTETIASKKLGVTDTGTAATWSTEVQSVLSDGVSETSRLKVSGGWTLATETQDGETWFWQSGADLNGFGLYITTRDCIEISDLGFLRYYYGIHLYHLVERHLLSNVVAIGSKKSGIKIYVGEKITISNFVSNGIGDFGIAIDKSAAIEISITQCDNASWASIFAALSRGIEIIDLSSDGSDTGFFFENSCGIQIASPNIANASSGIDAENSLDIVVNNYSSINVGIDIAISSGIYIEDPVISCQHFKTAGDNRCYYEYGESYRDIAEARSGACLKFDPSSATYYITQRFYCKAENGITRTVKIYTKDDVAFNGDVQAALYFLGKKITGWTEWTMTTSYIEQSIEAASEDVTEDGILELRIKVRGTAGNVYADDFSYE